MRIYCDGASRGNPGPSAIAYIILSNSGKVLRKRFKCVGFMTNNQAEYRAVIHALKAACKFTDQQIACFTDSELVVNQLNGEYKVNNPKLKTSWQKVQGLKKSFRKVTFEHRPREDAFIKEVDSMANQALDSDDY